MLPPPASPALANRPRIICCLLHGVNLAFSHLRCPPGIQGRGGKRTRARYLAEQHSEAGEELLHAGSGSEAAGDNVRKRVNP